MPKKGKVLWFTGLSGAGKTTLSLCLRDHFLSKGVFCIILDGDQLREGLNADLGFSREDRSENIRRIAEIGKLLAENGCVCITATISPYAELRTLARNIVGQDCFYEVYINASLAECERRDVKGLYRKARQNQISSFTGVQDNYVPPVNPDLEVKTDILPTEACIEHILQWYNEAINAENCIRQYP